MPSLCLSVSFRRASIDLLERLAVTDEGRDKAYRRLAEEPAVAESMILSTCNRVEVYAEVDGYHAGLGGLRRFLGELGEVSLAELDAVLDEHYQEAAAAHLFSVAAGLDSMVLGEPQILAQVRRAFREAKAREAAGMRMAALYRAAIRAGRRVRTQTAVGAAAAALVSAGVDRAEAWLGRLAGRPATVVGAGEMGWLVVRDLAGRRAGPIHIVSRRPERAGRLAAGAGPAGVSGGLDRLAEAVAASDLVVACTGAAGVVVGREALAGVRRPADPARRRFVLDLAVPRDVDPSAAEIPGLRLLDIDGLRGSFGEEGVDAVEMAAARRIVAREVERFVARARAESVGPAIRLLREAGDRALSAELARLRPRLQGLEEGERRTAEALARGAVAKLLHGPIVRLKEGAAEGAADGLVESIRRMFGPGPVGPE